MTVNIPLVRPDAFDGWDGSPAAAREMQKQLAGKVVLEDDFGLLRLIAGVDVGFEEGGNITRAAVVLLDAESLAPVAQALARIPTRMPYIPGLLSFRELPAVLQALESLGQTPDLILSDGHGIAHPRGLGIAAHLGVITGLPTIGVAKKILTGHHAPLGERRGDQVDLLDKGGKAIGTVLRSKDKVRPLIISPGNRVSLATAPELVMRYVTRYRLPEPTRLADRLASRRDEKRVGPQQAMDIE
ncbi:deoxyribonuclease V [Pseudomonas sp. KSR10]|uniref:deoxyribonuclease V n=1 Tax=Pseudomonas sp. KSR10 TaxID=2916654 RepID=UPI001EF7E6CE|nr:deoxyribonuclease V [Pseudomonas sp. KSR10]MCG6540734.1 deoxyribonuclease V [Pseudomonas sp. KSR10]